MVDKKRMLRRQAERELEREKDKMILKKHADNVIFCFGSFIRLAMVKKIYASRESGRTCWFISSLSWVPVKPSPSMT